MVETLQLCEIEANNVIVGRHFHKKIGKTISRVLIDSGILLSLLIKIESSHRLTKPDYAERETPIRPYDNVLASLLHNFPDLVYKYHEHDSLLEKNSEQDLSEEEKADAWAAYESDVNMKSK